jgi:peptidoglycan/xylan/chitin deacetylase (PgdA/CDA1 family)
MPKAIILMYHNIDNPPKGARIPNLYVTPGMFRFQMWYLRMAGFQVVSIQDLVASVELGETRRNLAAITFDDGYMDFYKNAYPVLNHYGYPSTVFIVSELVGKDNVWDSRNENIAKPLMDWKTLIEINCNGVEIGSHTKTHPELTRISSDQQIAEIAGSKKDLEEHLNNPIDTFCYPGGDHNDAVKEAVKRAGYRWAVTTRRGHVEKGNDPLALRRIPIKLIADPFSFLYKVHTNAEKRKGKQL